METQERDLSDSFRKFDPNNPPKTRVCALCLEDVDRETYSDHMAGHGYQTLSLEVKG